MLSGHFIDWKFESHASPLLIIAIISVLLILCESFFGDLLIRLGVDIKMKEMLVDEDLPNFFTSLKLSSTQELVKENENMKRNFGFETTDPDTIEALLKISMPKKMMQGTPWYQVLSNPNYS